MIRVRLTALIAGSARDVVVVADPASSVAELCRALNLDASVALPGVDPARPFLDAGVVPGIVVGPPDGVFDDELTPLGVAEDLRKRWQLLGNGLPSSSYEITSLVSRSPRAPTGDQSRSAMRRPHEQPRADSGPLPARLDIVSGMFAGTSLELPHGFALTIGRDSSCEIPIPDPTLELRHVTITRCREELTIRPLSDAEFWVDGETTSQFTTVPTGTLFVIGGTVFRFGRDETPTLSLMLEPGRGVVVSPSTWPQPTVMTPTVVLPPLEPARVTTSPSSWLSAFVPAVLAVVLAAVTSNPLALLATAFAPLTVAAHHMLLGGGRKARAEHQRTQRLIARAREQVARARAAQQEALWSRYRDPAAAGRGASRCDAGVWCKRSHESDSRTIRVGVHEVNVALHIEGKIPKPAHGTRAHSLGTMLTPTLIDAAAGGIGVTGDGMIHDGVLRWVVAQLAIANSPAEMNIVVVSGDDPTSEQRWSWTRWLPHIFPEQPGVGGIGNTPRSRSQRAEHLVSLINQRRAVRNVNPSAQLGANVLVVVDDVRFLYETPSLNYVLREGPAVGVVVVVAAADREQLPTECVWVLDLGTAGSAGRPGDFVADRAVLTGPAVVIDRIQLESVSVQWSERVARSLAPLHDDEAHRESTLPSGARRIGGIAGLLGGGAAGGEVESPANRTLPVKVVPYAWGNIATDPESWAAKAEKLARPDLQPQLEAQSERNHGAYSDQARREKPPRPTTLTIRSALAEGRQRGVIAPPTAGSRAFEVGGVEFGLNYVLIGLALGDSPTACTPVLWEVGSASHILIRGDTAVRCAVLQSLIAGVVAGYRADDVHIHALDDARGSIACAASAPHVGEVVVAGDGQAAAATVEWLIREITRREGMLAALGLQTIADQRVAAERVADRLPYIVMVIADEERWRRTGGCEAIIATLGAYASRGLVVGIRCVIADVALEATNPLVEACTVAEPLCVTVRGDRVEIGAGRVSASAVEAASNDTVGLSEVRFAHIAGDKLSSNQSEALRAVAAAAATWGSSGHVRPFKLSG